MLGYRAHFEVADRTTVVDDTLGELRTWLSGKGYDPDAIGAGAAAQIAADVDAAIIRVSRDDGSRSLRAQVVERKPEGSWTSELTVHFPADEGEAASILLDIHSPATDETQSIATGVPRLARGLLGTLDVRDSLAQLSDQPIIVRANEVGALAAAVRDPHRRGLLFVAGSSDSLPLKAWTRYVAKLLRQTAGLASAYVLDADATRLLGADLGPTHAVAAGTLRTYLPGVDTDSELDARRHRILSTTRIVNDRSQWLAAILGRRAKENALETDLPPALQAVLDEIAATADDALLGRVRASEPEPSSPAEPAAVPAENAVPAPGDVAATVAEAIEDDAPAQPETVDEPATNTTLSRADEAYLAASAVMHDVLGISDPMPQDWATLGEIARLGLQAERNQAEVASRIEDLRLENSQLGQDKRNVGRRLEDEQLEHAATFATLTSAEDELRRLRALLLQTEQAAAVYAAGDETIDDEPPASFVDLLANVPDLPGIEFTGDEAISVRLDVHDPLGLWASKTWAVLQALSDYAQASVAGRCDRDVHGYLLNLPDGCRGYSANKHATNESEDVQKNSKFSEARFLPVPEAVEPAGRIAMMAHFKIAQSGLISPRLHYYDDVTRSGKVYIGYIGPHLPTKRTN